MIAVPNAFAIHRYRPEHGPFRNILTAEPGRAEAILDVMRARPGHGWLVPSYLDERRLVEAWLRDGHRANEGRVLVEHPVYLTLWPALPALGPYDIVVELSAFEPQDLSFTYPDSMVSHGLAFQMRAGEEHELRPYHGRVFDQAGVAAVIDRFGWPHQAERTELRSGYDRSVEVQVWNVEPLLSLTTQIA